MDVKNNEPSRLSDLAYIEGYHLPCLKQTDIENDMKIYRGLDSMNLYQKRFEWHSPRSQSELKHIDSKDLYHRSIWLNYYYGMYSDLFIAYHKNKI